MTRLDGEKNSPLPYIIGLVVLAVLAAGIYYFMAQNRGADQAQISANGVELQDTQPAGLGADNASTTNTVDANSTDTNALDTNMADANTLSANTVDGNAIDSNNVDTNAALSNSADVNSVLSNSAMSNSAPSLTPAPMSSSATPDESAQVIASRSKTIKQGDTTVTYTKRVLKDGSTQRDKSIAAEPVKNAR